MSYTVSLYHIVFATRNRLDSITQPYKNELRQYISGIASNLKCKIICANPMPEHVHILVNLHPDVALSKFVATIKQSTSLWMKNSLKFLAFDGWAKEYYGVSLSPEAVENVTSYINNQEVHHLHVRFDEEIKEEVQSAGMQYYEDSLYR